MRGKQWNHSCNSTHRGDYIYWMFIERNRGACVRMLSCIPSADCWWAGYKNYIPSYTANRTFSPLVNDRSLPGNGSAMSKHVEPFFPWFNAVVSTTSKAKRPKPNRHNLAGKTHVTRSRPMGWAKYRRIWECAVTLKEQETYNVTGVMDRPAHTRRNARVVFAENSSCTKSPWGPGFGAHWFR